MKAKDSNKYSIISLFTGCGGLDLGFLGDFKYLDKSYDQLDFYIKWANDIDRFACLTFRQNFGEEIIEGDINELLDQNVVPSEADVVLGGFPCQDFSLAGKRRGFNGSRGLLYQSMVETVKRTRPFIFVAENVKGLLSMGDGNGGKAIDMINSEFEELGYELATKLYLSAEYEVPQSRERIIIVGTDKKRGLPKFQHPKAFLKNEKDWLSLKQAIGDLETVGEGEVENHYWSKAKRYPGTQGNNFVNADKIGPTMRAEHHGNIEFHWNKKRRLSAREAARIQSFPDEFTFLPSTSQAYRQIGNAVPPVMAWHIAKAVQEYLHANVRSRD